ncbi:hypothetical protein Hanom_Chr11g01000571 [Helianthus anomalus]
MQICCYLICWYFLLLVLIRSVIFAGFAVFGTVNYVGFDTFWIRAVMMQKKKKKTVYFDDDGAVRLGDGRFLKLHPHFAASDYRKKSEPNPFFSRIQTFVFDFCC